MECYVEAINGKKNFEAGEKIKNSYFKTKEKETYKKERIGWNLSLYYRYKKYFVI